MKGYVATPDAVVDLMVAKLFAAGPPKPGSIVLDAGCGGGAMLAGIIRYCKARKIPTPRMTGVELNPALAAKASKLPGVKIVNANFLTLALRPMDYIIANPPYVSVAKIPVGQREQYRTLFKSAHGRFDLYTLFFERCLSLMKPSGKLVFITPEKYQYVDSAAELRKLLAAKHVVELDFQAQDTFPGRTTYPVITTVAQGSGKTKVVRHAVATATLALPSDGRSWNGAISGGETAAEQVLDDVAQRISAGVATGCDDVYVLAAGQVPPQLKPYAHPTISGRQLLNGLSTQDCILAPYANTGQLLSEEYLGALGEFLGLQKARLNARTCVANGKKWYEYHDNFPARDMLKPKILFKDIAQKPKFWLDPTGNTVPRHTVYYLVPKDGVDAQALLDYLNGPIAAKWFTANCQRAAQGYLRLQSNVVRRLPIPKGLLAKPLVHSTLIARA